MYIFVIAEYIEGGVRGPNPMQSELEAAHEWLASS
jgi:hypothetical protein